MKLKNSIYLLNISVMDRYISSELMASFLFGVGMFSSLGVAAGVLFDLVNKVTEDGLSLFIALQVLFLKIPEFISYSLPISILLATLLTYGRLSSDSEIVALRSCGISVYRLAIPAIVLSFLISLITFGFNEVIVPKANYTATQLLKEAIAIETPLLNERDLFYPEYELTPEEVKDQPNQLKRLFYAKKFDGVALGDLTILSLSNQQLHQIIIAKIAQWNEKEQVWNLENGKIINIDQNNGYDDINNFEKTQISLPKEPFDLASQSRDPYEMNIAQSLSYLKLLRFSQDQKKILMFQVRMQQKISFPFICFVFGTIGTGLGIKPQNTGKATSFGLSIAIIFCYYLSSFIIGGFGIAGVLSPILAAWIPNFLGIGIGVILLRKNEG
jgi:lipopolysaccharide export system permease protein